MSYMELISDEFREEREIMFHRQMFALVTTEVGYVP